MEKNYEVKPLIRISGRKRMEFFLNSECVIFIEVGSEGYRGKPIFQEGKNQDKS